jgi:hypothetical protein
MNATLPPENSDAGKPLGLGLNDQLGPAPERALWDAMGCIADDEVCLRMLSAHIAERVTAERDRIGALLAAIRAHWVKSNGEDSLSVGALDVIAEVIADGSYVESGPRSDSGKRGGR